MQPFHFDHGPLFPEGASASGVKHLLGTDVLLSCLLVDLLVHQAKTTEVRAGAFLCWFAKAPQGHAVPAPLWQESLFHRSIMDLGFCNVILVKEENTR